MKSLILILICSVLAQAQGPLNRQLPLANNEANQLFESEQYEAAKEKYEKYYEEDPENGALAYNLGNVYSLLGETEKASELYRQAMASNNVEASNRGRFNLGTLQMGGEQPQPQEAVKSFSDYLRAKPDDIDGKRNLEQALRLMEQQEQQEDQESEDDESEDQQDQEDQESDQQQNKDQENEDQENESKDQQQQENQDQGEQEQQDQSEQDQSEQQQENQDQSEQEKNQQENEQQAEEKKENESKEDTLDEQVKQQILDALNEQELQQQQQYQKRKIGTVKRRAKDW